jgi:hypothetical protein
MAERSRARLFFEEVRGKKEDAFKFLASLLNGGEAAAENGWRDYKEAEFIGKTGNTDKENDTIKSRWSENLSAFANTSGGVLIWGIRTSGKIPEKLSLAADCEQLADRLRALVNDATDPYVTGVEVEPIKDTANGKAGFVVCYIPQSSFAPHQALWGERTYFIRTQDANLVCPQPLLRNMFYPRVLSRLKPTVTMRANKAQGGIIIAHLETRIANLGPATAETAIVSIEPKGLDNCRISYEPPWEEVGPKSVVTYRLPLLPNFAPPQRLNVVGTVLSEGALIKFILFAHNTPVHYSEISFTQEEVLKCLSGNDDLVREGATNPIYP